MATATIYLYEDPTQNYSVSCWADRSFSRGRAIVRKTTNTQSTSVGTVTTAGSITAGSLTSMPSSNLQSLVFSYAKVSNYKINISAATLYVTLASDTSFDSISVGDSFHSYPTYNTQYSGTVDLSRINTTEKTITATLKIDPQMSTSVLQALGGGNSWSVQSEAKPNYDQFYYLDTSDNSTYWYRYYYDGTGVQRSWCSVKVTNVYLVIEYEEDTSVIVDRSTAISMLSVGVSGVAKKINDMFIGVDGVAKKISEAWIGVNGIAKKIYPAYLVSMLSPGDIIQIDEDGNGTYSDWIVMHQNYYGAGETVLMRKQLLSTTKYLAYSGSVGQYGYPYFEGDADNYLRNTWLPTRSAEFQALPIETTITGRTWSGGTNKTAVRKIWLPSAVNLSQVEFPLGTETAYHDDPSGIFAYFAMDDTAARRVAYDVNGTAQVWWTRTTTGGYHPYCRRMTATGGFSNQNYYYTGYLRPVINVSSSNYVEEVSDGVYHIMSLSGSGQASLISFTHNGIEYVAEAGMTWYDWSYSPYNTAGFSCVSVDIRDPGGREIYLNGDLQNYGDLIQSGAAYISTGSGEPN